MNFTQSKKYSLWILVILSVWLLSFRASHLEKNEISWDVFGYYLPLEGTFIQDDPLLNDRVWVEKLNEKYQVSDTLYQISSTPNNDPMYFFLFGMSYMFAPFFFIGHFLAGLMGYPQDGLSLPYQYTLALGFVVYTIIGLIYLRKILLRFFSEQLTAILLIICVIGTNYSHHMTIKNLETVNVLFMFMALLLWNTIRWYEEQKLKNILMAGVSVIMMALIKPSEVLIILVPALWGLKSFGEIPQRIKLFWNYRNQIIITTIICIALVSPQIYYWHLKTGEFFYDSYKNPGVGLDVLSPHIYEALLGFRKGWLVYTPIMFFALFGFVVIFKKKRELFWGLLLPFCVSFYIIASWSEYWYGAGFSLRPVIIHYPLLLIAMGYFSQWLWEKRNVMRYSIAGVALLLVLLNQFQWWQFRNYIIDSTRMTKEYYWRTFLKTSVDPQDRELLLLERSYYPATLHVLKHPEKYQRKEVHLKDVKLVQGISQEEFINTAQIPFESLTSKDHCYAQFSMEYRLKNPKHKEIFFSAMMNRENGDYGPFYYKFDAKDSTWQHFDTLYLTPEIRNVKDNLKYFIWNPNKLEIEIRNQKLNVLAPKR